MGIIFLIMLYKILLDETNVSERIISNVPRILFDYWVNAK